MATEALLGLAPTPRAARLLAAAEEAARSRGHDYLGTEHLLLALAEERDGIAAQVLENLGCRGNVISELERIMNSVEYTTEAVHPDPV